MSLFGALKTDGLEETQDRLGGFQPLKTDIYTGPIKMIYAGQAASGARSITIIVDANGQEYRETIYITNKKGENFFLNKDDKTKKVPLPGFSTIDDICLVTSGAPLADQEAEDKMVKVYDTDAKKELPKSVPVLTGLIGKVVSLGIVQSLENKSVKDSSGDYVATAESRTVNTIDKVWHTETKLTVAEARAGTETPAFWDAWVAKNQNQVRDKRTIKDGVGPQTQNGRPGAAAPSGPPQGGTGTTARKSLFGAKS